MRLRIVFGRSLAVMFATCFLFSCAPKAHTLYLYSTNDLHGAFFSDTSSSAPSLSNVSELVNAQREKSGENSVLLIDVGDNLQGGDEVYYSNYKDTTSQKHLLTRVMEYIGYDAVVLGNHDIETGHPVYDKIKGEISIPYLAANAVDAESKVPYFTPYTIIKKGGVKVAVIGFENPNIAKWLAPSLWEGIEFLPTYPLAQDMVNRVREEHNPDLVILAVHGGLGTQEEHQVENPALYLAANVKGVDVVLAGHDHRVFSGKVFNGVDSVLVLDAGSRAKQVGYAEINLTKKGRKVLSKELESNIINMKGRSRDSEYDAYFSKDVEVVKEFVNQKIGEITEDISFEGALDGMSPYMNFIHLVQLESTGADVSISAPLSTKGKIKQGDVLYKNLFDLYRYENQLYVVKMSGAELKKYLEVSYHNWVKGIGPSFNYDSAAGLNYTVSRSGRKGKRVEITTMSDGSLFDLNKEYLVAMTSYRASGGGDLLLNSGINPSEIDERVVMRLPEIRELIYQYFNENKVVTPSEFIQNSKLGNWFFVK